VVCDLHYGREGVVLELQEWVALYQAVALTRAEKERSFWTIVTLFLVANVLLALPTGFLALSLPTLSVHVLQTGISAFGCALCLAWLLCLAYAAKDVARWESLLRSIEGQFAGAEFFRSAEKVLRGEQVCIPATSWKCGEWYPEVDRIRCLRRGAPAVVAVGLAFSSLAGWVVLLVAG
jgi:hypothetical protein